MKRLLLILLLILAGCKSVPEVVIVTATPEPSATATASDTPEPTPTLEAQDWLIEKAINGNFPLDGCTVQKLGLREFCVPNRWELAHTGTAPDARMVTPVGERRYLELRVESLVGDACLIQSNLLLDHSDELKFYNYVFKVSADLDNVKNYSGAELISLTFGIYADNSTAPYISPETFIWDQDYHDGYIWVIDPAETLYATYQFCFHFHGGLQKLDPSKEVVLKLYTLDVYRAGDLWGNDIEIPLG